MMDESVGGWRDGWVIGVSVGAEREKSVGVNEDGVGDCAWVVAAWEVNCGWIFFGGE